MVSSRVTVAVAQTSPRLGDVPANVRRVEEIVAALAGTAELVVFPELFTTGYHLGDLPLAALAEPLPVGPTVRRLGRAAARAGVTVVGSLIEVADGRLYDTAVVIDRRGELVASYRKSHLYPAERDHFEAGHALTVATVDGLRLGLAICFEHAFPEIFAELALAGAHVVAIPSAVPRGFEYLLELRTRARAQDNQLFVAASNLAGYDGRTAWCGGSLIVDPRGTVLASAGSDDESVITAELDLQLIERERAQEPIWANRRPHLYRRLRLATLPSPGGTPDSDDGLSGSDGEAWPPRLPSQPTDDSVEPAGSDREAPTAGPQPAGRQPHPDRNA